MYIYQLAAAMLLWYLNNGFAILQSALSNHIPDVKVVAVHVVVISQDIGRRT